MAQAGTVTAAAPTLPLKVSLTHLPNPAPETAHHPALTRSHHTLTVIENKAYIFGGEDPSGSLCPPAIHTITLPSEPTTTTTSPASTGASYTTLYTCYPPFTLQDPATGELLLPSPRSMHAACARGNNLLVVHGGRDGAGRPIAEDNNCLWQWDPRRLSWGKLRGDTQLGAAMAPRYGHWLFADERQDFLVLVGGKGDDNNQHVDTETEVWLYDFATLAWTALPRAPAIPLAAAYASGRVYIIARDGDGGGNAGLSGAVHFLDLRGSAAEREKPGALAWRSVTFPTHPLAPGPRPRAGGALVPLRTGYGREYLVYMFGCSEGDGEAREYYSDVWALQLPSRGFNPAAAIDKVRERLPGMESGEFRWAEVEVVPLEQAAGEGKAHPGPRGMFGADACLDGQGVILWGGTNAKEEKEGDGWVLRLAYGYEDNDRWE
ncbi:hypothetical protein VTK56DRAFT_3553 [Thermocarpiscus australiensis]